MTTTGGSGPAETPRSITDRYSIEWGQQAHSSDSTTTNSARRHTGGQPGDSTDNPGAATLSTAEVSRAIPVSQQRRGNLSGDTAQQRKTASTPEQHSDDQHDSLAQHDSNPSKSDQQGPAEPASTQQAASADSGGSSTASPGIPASRARLESRVSTATRIPVRRKRRATTPEATAQQGSTPRGRNYCISDSALSRTTRPPAERAAASTTAVAAAVAVPYARHYQHSRSESIHRAPDPRASGPAADGRASRENYTATARTASVEDGTASAQLPIVSHRPRRFTAAEA
jgi:hypothetical protein